MVHVSEPKVTVLWCRRNTSAQIHPETFMSLSLYVCQLFLLSVIRYKWKGWVTSVDLYKQLEAAHLHNSSTSCVGWMESLDKCILLYRCGLYMMLISIQSGDMPASNCALTWAWWLHCTSFMFSEINAMCPFTQIDGHYSSCNIMSNNIFIYFRWHCVKREFLLEDSGRPWSVRALQTSCCSLLSGLVWHDRTQPIEIHENHVLVLHRNKKRPTHVP